MAQPKKNNTRIALIAPEDAIYEPWTSNFGKSGMGYIDRMMNPNKYVTEARGEKWTSVEPEKNVIDSTTLPTDMEGWLNYASGDIKPLVEAAEANAAAKERSTMVALEKLGIVNAPIIKMSADPEIQDTREQDTIFDHMSAKQWKKAHRQLNHDERKLNRYVKRDSRVEQAIADKFGSAYNPANRQHVDEYIKKERQRIEDARNILNNEQ